MYGSNLWIMLVIFSDEIMSGMLIVIVLYLYVFEIKINKGGKLILSLGNVLTCDVA